MSKKFLDFEMIKRNQDIIDLGLLKDFFYFNFNRWIIVVSSIIVVIIYLYFLSIPNLYIFPNRNNFKFDFYTDSMNGGSSQIIKQIVSDSAILFEFDLKEGFVSPYVGMIIKPQKDSLVNLAPYNLVHLNIEENGIENIGFSFFTRNTNKKPAAKSTEYCFHMNLEISQEKTHYYIMLDQLRIPDWWRDVNYISPNEKIKPNLKKVLHINIGSAYSPKLGTNCLLKIKSISFERNNSDLIIFLIIAELTVLLFLIILYYIKGYLKKKMVSVTIAYKPVDIENETQQLKSFLTYINSNFHDNNLTLEHVSKYTGINHRNIANSIQQTFNCNFKTYVNQLRINESKRLLIESELNIGEIAFKVGFINQSHFNRVFKILVGMNPSEFRENKQ